MSEPMKEVADSLMWRGRESLAAAEEAMKRRARAQIALPPDVHHMIFQRLHEEAPPGAPEAVDVEGGGELLQRLASISGLAELAELAGLVDGAGYRCRIVSPAPTLILEPRE
ncbi:MAG TPA: hypothetical protein VLW45_07360 [Pelomicrobium sp.]|nr:hypothetical protein [Pelomicrobium sp.]